MESLDCVVIGAGVVGLAVARAQALAGREVMILESATAIGTGISSRNSEVIHAGLYYPPGSLKAALCVRGNPLLYAYCAMRHVDCRRLGKLVIAANEGQRAVLGDIVANARASGVTDLAWLDRAAVRATEPELSCEAALLSPSSGIVDSHGLMLSLEADAEAAGAQLALQSPVVSGSVCDGAEPVLVIGGADPLEFRARTVINCAGLAAQSVARTLTGLPATSIPEESFAKGNYFSLAGRTPFRHLIYPVPEPGGLGIHLTLDLAGRARFGPDVEWIETIDFHVDPHAAIRFERAIRNYWPGLPEASLAPDYAGVRPKLKRAGKGFSDFIVSGPTQHGCRGVFNLFAIESPGLTACLALAEHVLSLTTQTQAD